MDGAIESIERNIVGGVSPQARRVVIGMHDDLAGRVSLPTNDETTGAIGNRFGTACCSQHKFTTDQRVATKTAMSRLILQTEPPMPA